MEWPGFRVRWRDSPISIWRRFAIKVTGAQDPGKREQKYKTISKIQMLCLSGNIKIIVTSHISNYPSQREVSCPFDILIVNVGNNDDDDDDDKLD